MSCLIPPAVIGQCGAPAQPNFLHIEERCGSSVWPLHCHALIRTAVQVAPTALAGLAPGAMPAHSHAGIPASHGEVLGWVSCRAEGIGGGQAWGNSFKAPALPPIPTTFESSLTLEHNTVCWGAQSYCHVKGVREQRVGAAQCWKNTWREKVSVNVYLEQLCPCLGKR